MMTEREQALIQALPYGFIWLDSKKNMLFWNKIAESLLPLKHAKQKAELHKLITSLKPGTLEIQAPHRQNLRLALQLQPYEYNQFFLLIQDITHTYRLEKMRQDFVANVSHELRTPLTVFRGYLDLLLLEHAKTLEEPWYNALKQMSAQSIRMEGLVNDLLLLSNLEHEERSGHPHQYIQMAQLIQIVCQDAKSLNKKPQHQLIVDLDPHLNMMGAKEELRSAFSNILVNAIRYTPAPGRITVRWYANQRQQACFEVLDTGIGIEEKHIHRITQRFYRIDKARSRQYGGTGLGLAIVKHVLLRHQGRLTIESTPHVGSLFRCSFPLTTHTSSTESCRPLIVE